MRYIGWVGFVPSLLMVGVLGGLMAPPPSEAMTITIDGLDVTGSVTPYTCETGYSSCWYITTAINTPLTIAGTNDTWKVADVSTTNRARVRINDVGGTPATNVDKMNLTGIKLTPTTSTKKTAHIIITHTYSTGQGLGDYQWGMGVTGQFEPGPNATDTVLNNQFVLIGTGNFDTPDTTDPAIEIGRLDKGAFRTPQAPGSKGIVTQTLNPRTVKASCNTNGSNTCRPTIKFDFQTTVEGTDALVLTDSLLATGITCTPAQLDPLTPQLLVIAMNYFDAHTIAPHYPAPTHWSGVHAWLDLEAAKLHLDSGQLAKLHKLESDLDTWLASHSCAGKPAVELAKDSTSGVASGLAAGGTLATTCVESNTCGKIVIKKTIATKFDPDGCCIPANATIPQDIQKFGFDGTGVGIYSFSITTDGVQLPTGSTGSYSINSLDSASGPWIIKETIFPDSSITDPDGDGDAFWYTKSIICTPETGNGGVVYTKHKGLPNRLPVSNLDPTEQRSGSVTVTSLAANATLTCTFENGIFDD
ncbi:MAG: hypothetical protein WCH20_08495 [Nitrospira sp.]